MVLTLGHFGFPILYKSQKQKVVTPSSTEAELVCMYSGVDLALCYSRIGQFMEIATMGHEVHGFEVSMVEAAH